MSTATPVTAADGTEVLTRSWEPPGDPRAGVLIVHGLGEHSGRYEHVGAALAQRGFLVHGFDLPGFGASSGTRAYVERFGVFLDHVEERLTELASFDVPLVLFGHSLGGLIALSYVQGSGKLPDLLAVSAPALDTDIPRAKRVAAKVLSRIVPKLALPNDITGEQLARDPAVGAAYFADPLVYTKTSTRLGAESLAAMEETRQASTAGVPVPTLVLHGAEDTLVPTRSSASLEQVPDVDRIVFPEFRHESHNEDGGSVMIETLASWIEDRLPTV